jgi:DNA-binding Lrp family transcriptional regulator
MKPLFVKIKCELGATFEVANRLYDDVDETSEVYSTSGEYDLLVKFHLPESGSPGRFVAEKLHKVPGIRDTYTLIAFRIYNEQQERLGGETPSG